MVPFPFRQKSCRPGHGRANHNRLYHIGRGSDAVINIITAVPVVCLHLSVSVTSRFFALLYPIASRGTLLCGRCQGLLEIEKELRGSRLICICDLIWRCQNNLVPLPEMSASVQKYDQGFMFLLLCSNMRKALKVCNRTYRRLNTKVYIREGR